MLVLSSDILPLFIEAGWASGRQVLLPDSVLARISLKHPALEILAQFSGLTVGKCGGGELCATSDIEFEFIGDDWDEIPVWNELLHTTLVGVGYVHHGHGMLYVAEDGKCYELSFIADDFFYCGTDFVAAMRNYLFGRPQRPMIRPDQASVMFGGRIYTADDPIIYKY